MACGPSARLILTDRSIRVSKEERGTDDRPAAGREAAGQWRDSEGRRQEAPRIQALAPTFASRQPHGYAALAGRSTRIDSCQSRSSGLKAGRDFRVFRGLSL
jgi:hypothetical protein